MAQRPAYRRATQWIGLWLVFTLLGVAGMFTAIFWTIATKLDQQIGAWAGVIGFSPLVLGVVLAVVLTARFRRRRWSEIAQRLEGMGFSCESKPDEAKRTQFAAPILHLFPSHTLRHGAAGIQWYALQKGSARPALLFEHEYVTGSGKTTQTHHHTMIAWPDGHPDLAQATFLAQAEWLYLGRFSRFWRRQYRERALTLPELGDFTSTWTLIGSPATAQRFLTAKVRSVLASSPKTEVWSFGAGWVCCLIGGSLDADNLERFLCHGREVLASAGR